MKVIRTLASLMLAALVTLVVEQPVPARPIVAEPLPSQQSEVTITMAGATGRAKLGLPDLVVTGVDPDLTAMGRTVADVLWNDIDFEEEYYMIPRAESARIPAAPADALPYARWVELGADAVLAGSIRRNGADVTVEFRLISVRPDSQGRQLNFGRAYPNCRLQNARLCAHSIADDFHKETRALDGVARTMIAFSSDRDAVRPTGRPTQSTAPGKEIYVSDYDGGNQRRFTVNQHINNFPSWSPNGRLLAYTSWAAGAPDIYVANMAEPGPLRRPAGGGNNIQNWTPAWSPDGTKIAFGSTRSGNLDVWVVNSDGTGLQNLTPNTPNSQEGTPAWSPNGSQIAFASTRSGVNQLYMMNASGAGVPQRLTDQQIDRPTWGSTPSSSFIAFTIGGPGAYDIAIYDFSGGGVKVLTRGEGTNESPAVAPNGRHIAFLTTRWGKKQIATIDRAGRPESVRKVTEVGNNESPNWQPITR